ncbi:tetratricopeptide repeat protein [Lusitaniella coriacea LEGE 07167]
MSVKLSLCAIVKDEEDSLPQCLHSVKDVVDEMVILDTGSTDRTVEIAREFGARVYEFEWGNDFSAARNEALQHVLGEWVLVLDADEVLNGEILPQMREAMEREDCLAIALLREEVGATQSPYSLTSRLFRRHRELYFSRPYHASIDDRAIALLQKEPHWQVVSLPSVAIFHYGYQASAIAGRNKFRRAKEAMEGFLAEHPKDPYTCSKLGALYLQEGNIQEGIELLERGLQATEIESPVLFELHYHLGNGYRQSQDVNRAARHYQKALEQPIMPQLKLGAYNNLGSLLQGAGELKIAQKIYQEALKIDPIFTTGHYNLGMVLKAQGDLQGAIAAYQKAIQLNPDYAQAYQNLGVAWFKGGNVPESKKAFNRAIALYQTQNPQEAQRLIQGLKEMGLL